MEDELSKKSVDRFADLSRSIAELCPIAGPFISRLVQEIIPNQRMDRIAEMLKHLEREVNGIKEEEKQRMDDAEFADLFEEGIYQATRAATSERREHIAKILKNGLTSEHVDFLRERRLMLLLGDLNDLEVALLQFYNASETRDSTTQDRLQEIVTGPRPHIGSSSSEVESGILHRSHRERLVQLGLLRPRFAEAKKGTLPEFDNDTGTLKVRSYQIAQLGRLLMKAIDVKTIYDDWSSDPENQGEDR